MIDRGRRGECGGLVVAVVGMVMMMRVVVVVVVMMMLADAVVGCVCSCCVRTYVLFVCVCVCLCCLWFECEYELIVWSKLCAFYMGDGRTHTQHPENSGC